MMDYGLLMRRVMAQLVLVGDGATVTMGESRPGSGHPSRILSAPSVIRDSEDAVVYVSPYVLQQWWHRAHSTRRKQEVLTIALDVLRLARVRVKAKHDLGTLDGRLAVGREAIRDGVTKVAGHYGYSENHIYSLMQQAQTHDDREREERERELYDGTLEMRLRIAAEPGSSRSVALSFGVAHDSVLRWRRELLDDSQITGRAA